MFLEKVRETKLNPPTPEQVTRILDAAEDPYRLALVVSAWTGLRRSEVCGLRWEDVDLDAGVLHVRQTASYDGRTITFGEPKSETSKRSIPIPPRLVATLREARLAQIVGASLVATDHDGKPLHPGNLSKYFQRLTTSMGVRVRLHDLRHVAVTAQIAAGVDLAKVSAYAGHSATSFTARRYGHLRPDHLREAADAMQRAYGGS